MLLFAGEETLTVAKAGTANAQMNKRNDRADFIEKPPRAVERYSWNCEGGKFYINCDFNKKLLVAWSLIQRSIAES